MSLTDEEILNLPMGPNDAGDDDLTIKGYLKELLLTLWREGEGFNGKRPFGNSGWYLDFHAPLIQAGIIEGEYDEDNEVWESKDYYEARRITDEVTERLIESL